MQNITFFIAFFIFPFLLVSPFFLLLSIDKLMQKKGKYQGYWESDATVIPFLNILYFVVCAFHALYIILKKENEKDIN